MKNYKYILFDLDGTITNSQPGITKAAAYALESFGIRVDSLDSLRKFIGPPLSYSFSTFYGLKGEDVDKAVAKYREYYRVKGIYDCVVFDGIEKLLKELKAQGKQVILATSKPTLFATKILEHFNLKEYFSFISGPEMDGTRGEKPEVIEHAINQCNINVSQAVMIGDRFHDIQGAAQFKMDSIGVLYGFGEEKEFEGAVAIAKTPQELTRLLIGK